MKPFPLKTKANANYYFQIVDCKLIKLCPPVPARAGYNLMCTSKSYL